MKRQLLKLPKLKVSFIIVNTEVYKRMLYSLEKEPYNKSLVNFLIDSKVSPKGIKSMKLTTYNKAYEALPNLSFCILICPER